ncbi:MAG: glycosyltransferase [Arenicellales bacterium]
MQELKNTTLVVLASTYPRWANDAVPNFVENFVNRMSDKFRNVCVIAPHYKGAQRKERNPANNVCVRRFRYFIPYSRENIAYGEFRKDKSYSVKVLFYVWSELWTTFWVCIRSERPVINAHWLIPQGFVAVLLRPVFRCKVVISIHGADVFTLNGAVMRKLKRFALKRADAVVVNSSATREACEELYRREYRVIPMGVDITSFKTSRTREEGETFELLFVGRVVEEKGLGYLCEAMKVLRQRGFQAHLNIVGNGSAHDDIARYIKQHELDDVITLVGWIQQDRLAEYYSKADVFVGPSVEIENGWREAFGVALAEASASGLPVIATGTGGIEDIVKDEVNGLIVPQKDAQAIVHAVVRLREDPQLRDKLGRRGAGYIGENFSWDVVAARYEQVFKDA